MGIRRDLHIILACLVGTSVLFFIVDGQIQASQESSSFDWKEELRQIDEEIKKREDLRDRHLAAARRAEDQAIRWQFMQNQKQESKRAYERAEANKQEAAFLQEQVDLLKKRKAQLLKDHPDADTSKRAP